MKVSNTEAAAVTPGWVEGELDEIFAGLPGVTAAHQSAYADCLAGSRSGDTEASHDRCRETLLARLDSDGVPAEVRAGLREKLEALEAEITART